METIKNKFKVISFVLIASIILSSGLIYALGVGYDNNELPGITRSTNKVISNNSGGGSSEDTVCFSMGNINTGSNYLGVGGLVCQSDNCYSAIDPSTITAISLAWRQNGAAIIAGNQGAFTLNLTVNGEVKNTYYYPYVDVNTKDVFINDSLSVPLNKYDNVSIFYGRINGSYIVGFPSYCVRMIHG